MPKPIKIALTGKMRSGKSFISDYLFVKHGFELPIAFGDKLKIVYHELFPWVDRKSKPRADYQKFGQLMREHFDANVWIRHVEYRVKALEKLRNVRGIVIEDLRQPNEYEWARANGFVIVRVSAPDELRLERARLAGDNFTEADLAHETEQWVDGFEVDFEIMNDGTFGELKAKVDEMIRIIHSSTEK